MLVYRRKITALLLAVAMISSAAMPSRALGQINGPDSETESTDPQMIKTATASNAEALSDTATASNAAVKDTGILMEAKNYVQPSDKVTGDDGSCANMDPGVYLKIQADKRFDGAFYELQMRTCGNERGYEIEVNGQNAGVYTVTGSGFGMDQLHEDGWQGRFRLKDKDELVIKAPDGSYGWIKEIYLRELPEKFLQKDPDTGIVVESEDELLPKGTELKIKQVADKDMDLYFEEMGTRAVYYDIQLERPSETSYGVSEDSGRGMSVEMPLPPGFIRGDDATDIYYIHDGIPECLRGTWTESGKSFRAGMELPENDKGVYALTTSKGRYRYEAEDYYKALSDNDSAANFETGNGTTLEFAVEKKHGFISGNYNLLMRYSGGGDSPIKVLVNGEPAGTVKLSYTDWGNYRVGAAEAYLSLKPGDRVAIAAPEGQYHWIDYLELKEAEPFYAEEAGITVSAGVGALPYGARLALEEGYLGPEADLMEQRIRGADGMRVFRMYFYLDDPDQPLLPAGPAEVSMEFPGEFNVSKFCLYHVSGEGLGMKCIKIPSSLEDGELKFSLTKENGVFALVSGGASVPADYDNDSIYRRMGGMKSNGENTGFQTQVKSRMEDGRYIYEGEAYYKAQGEHPAADLQPGAQINIPLSDNSEFKSGKYRLVVRSNGNRQLFRVKVNQEEVGTISRFGTDFQMFSMTDDAMVYGVELNPSDLLTIEAEGGENYGWVDYVALERIEGQKGDTMEVVERPVSGGVTKEEYRYDGENYYQASAYSPAADLQAGDSIHIPLSDDPDFKAGAYRLSVISNGTRELFTVSVNGQPAGVIRKKAADYSDTDYSQDYMEGIISLKPGDTLTLTGQEGDYFGWVNYILLEKDNP